MVSLQDLIHRLKSLNHLVQHNKQHHRKVLLNSFHLNGHTSGFNPQTEKLEPHCQHSEYVLGAGEFVAFFCVLQPLLAMFACLGRLDT